jgi:hypothetical protein
LEKRRYGYFRNEEFHGINLEEGSKGHAQEKVGREKADKEVSLGT